MHRPFNSLLARLLLGSAIPLVLFVGVALVAATFIFRMRDTLLLEDHSRDVIRLGLLQQQEADRMRLAVRVLPRRKPEEVRQDYESHRAEFYRLDALLAGLVGDNSTQAAKLRAVATAEGRWHEVVEDFLLRLRQQDDPRPDAEQISQAYFENALPLLGELETAIQTFLDEEQELLTLRRDRTATEMSRGLLIIGASLALAVVLTVVLSYLSARDVARPIERLSQASGDLIAGQQRQVPVSGPNEVARLIVHFNHMAITLTERASTLQRREERYRTYVGAGTHLMWNTDAKGDVVGELPTWQAFTGQGTEGVCGRGWFDAVHPEERPAVEARWRACVAERKPFEMEYRLRAANGEYRDFYCRGVPVVGADGSLREWVGTCTDITERKREASLRQAKEAAESSSRAKSEFLTKMSHELRTPLNAVIGMSRMLLTKRFGSLNAKQADYLRDITQSGEHLLALINDILDLSKVEAGKMDVNPQRFALGDAVASLVSSLRSLADTKGVGLSTEPAAEGTIHSDPARFRQVLLNLLSNAIKFTNKGGRVTVTWEWVDRPERDANPAAEAEASAVRLTVRDTGIGIALEDQPRIWDEFRQLKSSAIVAQEGTGLGLALVRRLVRLLGGTVWLKSVPGEGSDFTFVLPRDIPAQAAHDGGDGRDGRSLVLVVEDHPPTHKLLVDWLESAGLATASAYDGEAGLELARRLRPHLVVLDIHLPKRDGWQVLTELKSDPATAAMPVVVMSVTEDRQPASAFGVQEYFIKPVDRDPFLERLRGTQPGLFRKDRPTSVLLVDDDPATRKLLGDMLRAEGLTVREASDGQEALKLLRQERPDALVLDLMMPEVDGFGVIEAIRSEPEWHDLPVLVVTAKDMTEADRRRINGRIQALMDKHLLTPERLQQHLRDMGLGSPSA